MLATDKSITWQNKGATLLLSSPSFTSVYVTAGPAHFLTGGHFADEDMGVMRVSVVDVFVTTAKASSNSSSDILPTLFNDSMSKLTDGCKFCHVR